MIVLEATAGRGPTPRMPGGRDSYMTITVDQHPTASTKLLILERHAPNSSDDAPFAGGKLEAPCEMHAAEALRWLEQQVHEKTHRGSGGSKIELAKRYQLVFLQARGVDCVLSLSAVHAAAFQAKSLELLTLQQVDASTIAEAVLRGRDGKAAPAPAAPAAPAAPTAPAAPAAPAASTAPAASAAPAGSAPVLAARVCAALTVPSLSTASSSTALVTAVLATPTAAAPLARATLHAAPHAGAP